MRSSCPTRRAVYFAATMALISWSAAAFGQTAGWTLTSMSQNLAAATQPPPQSHALPRGPLARLVRNPHTADGSPPFALTDQAGAIQRLVEPVPGVELDPYVGQVVVVRHDTGRTVLATQLELPPRPLMPLSGQAETSSGTLEKLDSTSHAGGVTQAVQIVDHDDATTQLITDEPTASGSGGTPGVTTAPTSTSAGSAVGELAPIDLSLEGPHIGGSMIVDGIPHDGMMLESWPEGYLESPGACPECGEYHDPLGDHPHVLSGLRPRLAALGNLGNCRFYADVEIQFLRVHLMENAVGKLAEKYEFSPQFTVGFDGTGLVDGRARYWIYDRATPILSGDHVRVEFHVFDLEATHRFQAGRADVGLAVGMRIAGIDLEDNDGDRVGIDLLGMTLAADARTPLCNFAEGTVSWVYGGRVSILGGDWGGSPNSDFLTAPLRDDNVMAEEIYIGVEFATGYRDFNVRARLAFEIQNWHSDVLAQEAGTDSIGFIGPGAHVGVAF